MNPQDDFDMSIELSSLVTLLMNQQPTRKIFTYFRLSWCCSHNRAHIPLALALVYSRLFLFSCFGLPFLYPFLGKLLLARAHLGKLWGAVIEKIIRHINILQGLYYNIKSSYFDTKFDILILRLGKYNIKSLIYY